MHLSQLACNLSSYFIFTALRSTPWDQVLNLFYIPNGYILCFGLGDVGRLGKLCFLERQKGGRREEGSQRRSRNPGAELRGNLDPVTTQSSDSARRWESPPFAALTATAANGRRGHPAPAQEGGYFLLLPWAGRGRPSFSEDVGPWKAGPRLRLVKSVHKNRGRGLCSPLRPLLPFKIRAQLEVTASTRAIVDKKRTWSAN